MDGTKLRGLISLLLGILILTAVGLFIWYPPAQEVLMNIVTYIESNKTTGSVLYVFLFAAVSCMLIPITPTMLICAVLFKPVYLAILIVFIGAEVGIVLAFLMGRTFLRPYLLSVVGKNPKYVAIDNAVEQHDWKIVILLRLTAIVPFGVQNYLLSTTKIKIVTVMWATLIGCLPGFTTIPILGSFLGTVSEVRQYQIPLKYQIAGGLSVVCFVAMTSTFFSIIGRNALKSIANLDLNQENGIAQDTADASQLENSPVSESTGKIVFSDSDKRTIKIVFGICAIILTVGMPIVFTFF
jgi:uncharacterized membrane protein YdjX (TVP38/TMEM64 family)